MFENFVIKIKTQPLLRGTILQYFIYYFQVIWNQWCLIGIVRFMILNCKQLTDQLYHFTIHRMESQIVASSSGLSNKQVLTEEIAEQQPSNLKDLHLSFGLDLLNYERMSAYCILCLQKIKEKKSCLCYYCARSVHSRCFNSLKLRLQIQIGCRMCQFEDKCAKCCYSVQPSSNTITCSLCFRMIHQKCFGLPLQLLQISNMHLQKYYEEKDERAKTVCHDCMKLWKTTEKVDGRVIENIHYGLFRISHPSPVHRVWIEETSENKKRNMEVEEDVVMMGNKASQIENIFSIDTSEKRKMDCTIKQIFLKCFAPAQERVKQNERCKFLVKWEDSPQLVWQDESVVRPFKNLMRNFFNNIIIRLYSNQGHSQSRKKIELLLEEIQRGDLNFGPINMIGSRFEFKQEKNKKIEKEVLRLYEAGYKQNIKAKRENDSFRMEVVTRLINTIYFEFKTLSPVLIFTQHKKVKWWMNQLKKRCPNHTTFHLSGPEKYVRNILTNYYRETIKKKDKFKNYVFDILIIPFEKIAFIHSIRSLSILISESALMIADENISEVCKNLYQMALIPKIKFTAKGKEESISSNELKITRNSSVPETSKSIQGLKNMSEIKETNYFCEAQGFQSNEKIGSPPTTEVMNTVWESIEKKYEENGLSEDELLDELHRIVFLRYVLAFGLTAKNSTEMFIGLRKMEHSFLEKINEQKRQDAVHQYTKQFLTVLSAFSQSNDQNLPHGIKAYYLFDAKPKQLIKRISILNQMKKCCDNYKINNELSPEISDVNDVKICEAVLERGFGRWEAASELKKVWESGWPVLSLRIYFCLKAEIDFISITCFSTMIHKRFLTVMSSFKEKGSK